MKISTFALTVWSLGVFSPLNALPVAENSPNIVTSGIGPLNEAWKHFVGSVQTIESTEEARDTKRLNYNTEQTSRGRIENTQEVDGKNLRHSRGQDVEQIHVDDRGFNTGSQLEKRQFISPDQFVAQILANQQSASSSQSAMATMTTTTSTPITASAAAPSTSLEPITPQVVTMLCTDIDDLPLLISNLLFVTPLQVSAFKGYCSFELTTAKIQELQSLGYEAVWEADVAQIVKIQQVDSIIVSPEISGQQSSVPNNLLFGQVTLVPGDVLILSNDTAQLVYGSKLLSSVSLDAANLIQVIQDMDERWLPFLLQVSPRPLPVFINSQQMDYLSTLGWQLNLTPQRKFVLTNPNLANYNMTNPLVPYAYPFVNTTADKGFLLQHQLLLAVLPAPQPLIMDYLMEQLGYFAGAITTGTDIGGNTMVLANKQINALLQGKYAWQKASPQFPSAYILGISLKGSGSLKSPLDPFFTGLLGSNTDSSNQTTLASAWELMLPYGHLSQVVNNVVSSASGLSNTSLVITNSSDANGSILKKIMQLTGSPILTLTNAPQPFDQGSLLQEAQSVNFAENPQDDWTLGKRRTVKRSVADIDINIQDLFDSDPELRFIGKGTVWTISMSIEEGSETLSNYQSLPNDSPYAPSSSRTDTHQAVLLPSHSTSPKELAPSRQRCKPPLAVSIARWFDNAFTSLSTLKSSLSSSFRIVCNGIHEAFGSDIYDDEEDDDLIYS